MDFNSVYSSHVSGTNKMATLFPLYFSCYVLHSAIRNAKEFLSLSWNITTLNITSQTRIQSLASKNFGRTSQTVKITVPFLELAI